MQLLQALMESSSVSTIEDLNLYDSSDFTSNEACTLLCTLIDMAPNLAKFDIRHQIGERKVKVELQLGTKETNGESGLIKVVNEQTKEAIVQVTTSRKTNVQFVNDEKYDPYGRRGLTD